MLSYDAGWPCISVLNYHFTSISCVQRTHRSEDPITNVLPSLWLQAESIKLLKSGAVALRKETTGCC